MNLLVKATRGDTEQRRCKLLRDFKVYLKVSDVTAVVRLWSHLETLDEMPLDTLTIDQAFLTVWASSGRVSRWVPLRNTDQDRSRQIYMYAYNYKNQGCFS